MDHRLKAKHPTMVLLHGGGPKGAELIAAKWADSRGVPQVAFRPSETAGITRCLARSSTWATSPSHALIVPSPKGGNQSSQAESTNIRISHAHTRGQFTRGLGGITARPARADCLLIPPEHGLGIPSGVVHRSCSSADVDVQTFDVEVGAMPEEADACRLV